MSEANYPEVQLQHHFGKDEWLAQIFTPRETHEMEYVSLKLEPFIWVDYVEIAIQYIFAGVPTGIDLATARIHWVTLIKAPRNKTILFRFRPLWRVILTIEYGLILRVPTATGGRRVKATYEAPPGHYPRGKLIRSTDGGSSWDTTDLGDLFFAEWGNPPVIIIKPDPPLKNFAIIDLAYTHWDIGLVIRLPTNVPCHLTCYWTDVEPRKHHTTRVVRGLTVPWYTYFCFVSWQAVEQEEYGSTLYHTFDFPDWQEGETRWFTFRGEVDLEEVPSVGPIFKHTHPGGLPRNVILYPIAPGYRCTITHQVGAACPDHYLNVDEVIPDEDASYVRTLSYFATIWRDDLYRIQTFDLGAIDKVTILNRFKTTGTRPTARCVCFEIRSHGVIYRSAKMSIPTGWHDREWLHFTNPNTGKRWTQADIDDLQVGTYLGSIQYIGAMQTGYCTQAHAIVRRGINGGPD